MQNIEAERAVVGCLVLEPHYAPDIFNKLNKDDFTDPDCAKIFNSSKELFDADKPVSLAHISDKGIESWRITEIANLACAGFEIEHYIDVVKSNSIKRHAKNYLSEYAEDMPEAEDPQKLIDELSEKLSSLTVTNSSDYITNWELMHQTVDEIEQRENGQLVSGIPTGYPDLDSYTGGWHRGDLIFLAAVPKMGKTSVALEFAMRVARQGYSVLYFSLEMSPREMAQRQISNATNINNTDIKTGKVGDDWGVIVKSLNDLASMKIGWVDRRGITSTQIKAICKKYKMQHGLDFVVVDQLDKIDTRTRSGENRTDAVKRNTVALKNMAYELDSTVLCLAQLLDKVVAQRSVPRPTYGDEKGSSSPSEDADAVMFMWRPEFYWHGYYGGMAELIISRQRAGPAGSIWLSWYPHITKFESMPKEYWPEEVKQP